MNPKMRYDQEDDVLMIWFAEGKHVDHAEQVGQSILHLTQNDEPILLEILNARNFILNMVSTAIAPVESAAS